MYLFRIKFRFLLPLLAALVVQPAFCQTPAPAELTQFALPLADQTSATAMILPIADGQAYLVYATKTGLLGSWTMTQTGTTPQPPTPIPPTPIPPTPVPPTPVPPDNVLPPLPDWIYQGAFPKSFSCPRGRRCK